MKRIKIFGIAVLSCLTFLMPLTACNSNPVDETFDAVEDMADTKEDTENALEDFHQNADEKDEEAQKILDMVE